MKEILNLVKNKDNVKDKLDELQNEPSIELTIQEKNNKQKTVGNIFKKIYDNLINTKLFVTIMIIIVLLKTILLYKVTLFPNNHLEFKEIYMSSSFICVLFTIPMIIKNKPRFILAILMNFFVSFLLCINEIYYSYASNLVSISQI